MPVRLTLAQARRIGLAAQGFGRPRPARVTARHVQAEIARVAQFQIDSVSVAVRAQYVPLFARLGPYDTALLDAASGRAPRRLFEYWGHAASLIDVNLEPALRLRVRRNRERTYPRVARVVAANPDLADRILADVAERGPLTARGIDHVEERRRDHWGWNWSQAKIILEHLFDTGRLAVADRNSAFERRYDLPERVLPAAVLATPDPTDDDATDALVRRAASALGVFDLGGVAEYFYLHRARVAASLARLTAAGDVEPVEVTGVPGRHWLWHAARRPRTMEACALVSPFDSMVFERTRLERLYGTHYRIEIYVPAAQRRHGYYVYLFWLGDSPAARVDLKADRAAGVLRVQSAWLEQESGHGRDAVAVARALASELHLMASWQGLTDVAVAARGTLADVLAAFV